MSHRIRSAGLVVLAALTVVALAQSAFPAARTSLGELFSGPG